MKKSKKYPPYMYFKNDYYPLWEYLNLNKNFRIEDVTPAYKKAINSDENINEDLAYFAWKLLKDPFYSELYINKQSIQEMYEYGFFIDGITLDENDIFDSIYDFNWFTTSIEKVKQNIKNEVKNDKPFIVLLSTGGFSPFHKEHLNILEHAKNKMEQEGFIVAGGYISPSHDIYVSSKHNGRAALNIEKRVYLIEKSIKNSKYYSVDKWEGYYNFKAINYTDVITRLEGYLNHHIKTKNGIKICKVFGSDNVGFLNTFKNKGYAVCVNRVNVNDNICSRNKATDLDNDRVFILDSFDNKASSTLIRNGDLSYLNENIREDYTNIIKDNKNNDNLIYGIRDDLYLSTKEIGFDEEQLIKFKNDFINLIKNSLNYHCKNINIQLISVEEQIKEANKIINRTDMKTLSLDVYIKGNENFCISRLFNLSDYQFHGTQLTARPNNISIEKQIQNIPSNNYMLIEDDVISGESLRLFYNLIPDNIKIKKELILSKLDNNNTQDLFDIIDLRDFVIGSKHGGLVVSTPKDNIVRAPYVLPYVTMTTRANIPLSRELFFSYKIWELNEILYKNSDVIIRLKDVDYNFQNLMIYMGFKLSDSMEYICKWHKNKLITYKDMSYCEELPN